MILGACPGGLSFGVGSEKWRTLGDEVGGAEVAKESCWEDVASDTEEEPELHLRHTLRFAECFGKCTESCTNNAAGCANFNAVPKPDQCFSSITHISRLTGGDNSNGAYTLKQGLVNGSAMVRCRDQIGDRCCPGNKGPGCQSCCTAENIPSGHDTRNCNNKQWYSKEDSSGGSCKVCPEGQSNPVLFCFVGFLVILFAPIIAKGAELAKHAGAAQGPVLSIMNFFQSSDLFQGLKLNWPPEFRTFCRTVAGLFSFNLSQLLSQLNDFIHSIIEFHLPPWLRKLIPHLSLPPPACALHLPYERKWILSMASPLFVVFGMLVLVLVRFLSGMASRLIVRVFPKSVRRAKKCSRKCMRCLCCCCRRQQKTEDDDRDHTHDSSDSDLDVDEKSDEAAEPETELEVTLPLRHSVPPEGADGPQRPRCQSCPNWAKFSSDFRLFLRGISRAVLV